MRRWLIGLWGLAVGAGCAADATSLVVVVRSDFTVPEELAAVRVEVGGAFGSDFSLEGPGAVVLPFSFALAPQDDDDARAVDLTVTPFDVARQAGREVRIRTGFLEGQELLLPVELLRACESLGCGPDERCVNEGCVSQVVDPSTLRPVTPGEEI